MKKDEAIALLRDWLAAIEHAQKVHAEEQAKPRSSYDGWRPEGAAWCALNGWIGNFDRGADDRRRPSIIDRTRAALGVKASPSVAATADRCTVENCCQGRELKGHRR